MSSPYDESDQVREAINDLLKRRYMESFDGRDGAERAKKAIDTLSQDLGGPVYNDWRKKQE